MKPKMSLKIEEQKIMIIFVYLLLINIKQYLSTPIHRQTSDFKFIEKTCSRQHSKLVREYFARAILPIYQKYSVPIPQDCEFSPLNDIYYYQENNKTKLEQMKWKCELCGKIFLSENYLDSHFTHKHNDSLYISSNGTIICLADLCHIFRCEVLQNKNNFKNKRCTDTEMDLLKDRCDRMLDTCIPKSISVEKRNALSNELYIKICSYLDCAKYHELPQFMSQGPSFLLIFIIVVLIGLCIIVYGVLNHTDLIYNENEPQLPLEGEETNDEENDPNNVQNQHLYTKLVEKNSSNSILSLRNNEIRQRKTVTFKDD